MRVFLTILFFALYFLAKGQLSKEEFLNKIRPLIIDTAINHYYLFKQTETLYYNRQLGTDIKQELLKLFPEDAANDIITSISSDTVETWWDENLLLDATLVNAKQADTLIGSIVFNYTGLNKKQQKKLRKDLISKRERVYYFSRPIFDRSREFALVQMRYACGTACGNGCLYLFKLYNGRWIKINEMSCWIS